MGIQVGAIFTADLATYAPDLDYGIVQIPYPVQSNLVQRLLSRALVRATFKNRIEAVEFASLPAER